jgi:hypothetical protein
MASSCRYLPSLMLLAAVAAGCTADDPPRMGAVCVPGNQRCSENRFQTCASDGDSWVTSLDCVADGLLCFPGVGCKTCSPGTVQCGGDGFDIVRCADDGNSYETVGRCDPENGQLCGGEGACANACDITSQQRSYEGCDYWAVDLDNAVTNDLGPAAAQQYSIVITNPLEIPAAVKVEVNDAPPGQPPELRTVASTFLDRVPGGGDLKIINLDAREVDCSSDPRLNDGTGSCLSSRAFHVTSTAPIVAYQFNPLENVNVFSNDASLLLPEGALGGTYLVMGWPQTIAVTTDASTNFGENLRAFLTIVGTEEATGVAVTLTTRTLPAEGIPAGLPGDTLTFTLGPHDVVNLETDDFNADFTGTEVRAGKPVAVFSGSEASDAPLFPTLATRDCCADHLEEQLFPETAFGTSYVATESPRRTFYVHEAGWDVPVLEREPEVWRILASVGEFSTGTVVHTSLPPPNDVIGLGRGQYVTIEASRDFVIWADNPISVAQVQTGQQTTGIPTSTPAGQRIPGGDPSLTIVPPVEQWKDKYVFLVPNKYLFDFLLLSMPKGTKILYDGIPLEQALPRCEYASAGEIPARNDASQLTEYLSAKCPLSRVHAADPADPAGQDDGRHTLKSVDGKPFGLVVYGFDSFVSYAYPGGANVDVINPL